MTCSVHFDPTRDAYAGPIDLYRPHFVGIGGTVMSALARLCAARGFQVSGSDATDSPTLVALRAAGCQVDVGHNPTHVFGATCVVYTAVTANTMEVAAARQAGIPVVHRAQVLEALCDLRRLVAVSGTHGKSTTTGMIASALVDLGADPSFAVGADLDDLGSGARHGGGDLVVAEADESDRSFHFLTPAVAVVTNIAHDHPENYADLTDHVDAYLTFAVGIQHGGLLVVNADDDGAALLTKRVRTARGDLRIVTYGQSGHADMRICSITRTGWSTTVTVGLPGGQVSVTVPTPSTYHGRNAVAALAAVVGLGYEPGFAAKAVSAFSGVRRRFSKVGEVAGVRIVDSYADHPNEIAADLAAAQAAAGDHKVVVVFQPSGYTRVAAFGKQMGIVLAAGADKVLMLDVHGIAPVDGVTSSVVADACAAAGGSVDLVSFTDVPKLVSASVGQGDVVLTMGTGNVTGLGEKILTTLGAEARVTG